MSDVTGQDQAQASAADFVALKPGRRIGRYEVVAILGQGGFGITYRARDTQLAREVAIKEYLPSALAVRHDGATVLPRSTKVAEDFGWGRERFVAEGRTLATLQGAPGIVQVYDFLEANGTAYIVMELVPGETLERRLQRAGRLGAAEVERIAVPLLDGLERVHRTGFLHRDIKPANILLDDGGHPTLIDFGASRAAMAGRTAAMTAIFTPGYAAAEQFTSAKQGPWTDIYGVAATLYHAITGTVPPSAFERMLNDTYEPLARIAPDGFAPGLLYGIDAGLAVRAAERPQTIADWRRVLDGTVVPDGPAPVAAPARRRLWFGAMALGLLLLAGGGAYEYSRSVGPDPGSVETERKQREAAAAEEARQKARDAELAKLAAEHQARAEAERQEALRQKIEEDVRHKFEADRAAQKKAAEESRAAVVAPPTLPDPAAAETALNLTLRDRQRVQIALTAAGFSTNGSDGVFGPRTREMISAWQKARGLPTTGFLTGQQNQALLQEQAVAVRQFDDEQKKRPAAMPFDGLYAGSADKGGDGPATTVRIVNGKGSGSWNVMRCGPEFTARFSLSIDSSGNTALVVDGFNDRCQAVNLPASGRMINGHLDILFGKGGRHLVLDRTGD